MRLPLKCRNTGAFLDSASFVRSNTSRTDVAPLRNRWHHEHLRSVPLLAQPCAAPSSDSGGLSDEVPVGSSQPHSLQTLSNQNEHYSVRPTAEDGITVHLFPRERARFQARLLDQSNDKLVIVYSPWGDANLQEGEHLGLRLSMGDDSESLWFEGEVTEVIPSELHVRTELQIAGGDIQERVSDATWTAFNRRRRPRVHFGPSSTLTATIHNSNGELLSQGTLYDLSVSGLCFRVGRMDLRPLAELDPLRVCFSLPGSSGVQLLARIRDIRVDDDAFLVGMALESGPLGDSHPVVTDFVSHSVI